MASKQFTVGTPVWLKVGNSPDMIISQVLAGDMYACHWIDAKDQPQDRNYHADMLTDVSPVSPPTQSDDEVVIF